MCHNHLGSQEEVNLALAHELIHAYDHCRGANVDWTNCEHHACSEVRIYMLSSGLYFADCMEAGLGWASFAVGCRDVPCEPPPSNAAIACLGFAGQGSQSEW